MPATERGVWEPTGRMGVGIKDEVNIPEPNNQHFDVFTGWPSSMGAAEQSRLPGLGALRQLAAKNNKMESFCEGSKYVLHLIPNPTTRSV